MKGARAVAKFGCQDEGNFAPGQPKGLKESFSTKGGRRDREAPGRDGRKTSQKNNEEE